MGRFYEAVKAGVKGFKDAHEPTEYSIAGRMVKCPHCGETKFAPGRRALLNSRAATFLNVDWTDAGATVLVCAECGRIEWFAREPAEVPAPRKAVAAPRTKI